MFGRQDRLRIDSNAADCYSTEQKGVAKCREAISEMEREVNRWAMDYTVKINIAAVQVRLTIF